MAVNNYETTLREWENIIRVNLKVTNPALLKSGALGILSNYLASIKFDSLQYYSKAFQEMNPGLAQDFNSMLYHASIFGAEVDFATPSTLVASLIVPEITLKHVSSLVYEIPKNAEFTDTNGIPFMTTSSIKIEQGPMHISATTWSELAGTRKLSITRAPNPNVPGKYVYLIHANVYGQLKRSFYSQTVNSAPIVGQPFEYDIGVKELNQVENLKAWSNTGTPLKLDELKTMDLEALAETSKDITELNVKFYKFESSNRDKDLFIEMFPNSLSFETGDGIHGALPEEGSQIINEVRTTLGVSGNVPNSEFLLSGVTVTEVWSNSSQKAYTTAINGMSAVGSSGGQSIEGIDSIRNEIFTQISTRDSIITENDYETMYAYDGVRPFIDAKFIDAQAFVFMFNVLRSNDIVVPSTAINMPEVDLLNVDVDGHGGPFYPTYVHKGITLLSPFYYKNLNSNRVDAYMVDPKLDIMLRGDLRTPDPEVLKDYKVELAVTYDFNTNSSYLEILSGAQEDIEYYFISDQFRVTISSDSNDNVVPFTYKISQLFTDAYCIMNEPLTGIKLHAKNKQGEVLASYISEDTYDQLIKKQTFYKYFQDVEEEPNVSASSDTMAYLDNLRGGAMSTMADIRSGTELLSTPEVPVEKYILRLPYVSRDFFYSRTADEMFDLFNSYFIMDMTADLINYNTLAAQTFHNTIDIPPKYYDSLFERNTMPVSYNPKLAIEVEIHGDRDKFMTSKYENSTEFDTAIRIEIIKFLKQKEGFTIEFFETDLEKHLYDTFDPLIKNVAVLSPTLFQVNSSAEVYKNIEETLDFQDVLEFIPPYFHYDYAGMSLTITW